MNQKNQRDREYDFEERAAIRELDAGFGRERAEQLAAADIQARRFYKDKVGRTQLRQSVGLAELRRQRDAVGREMRMADNQKDKDELFRQWMELTSRIIDLRKEL